jgi:hypothetical protein
MIQVSDRLTFCLNCFRQIDREATRCPFCGNEADRWHETDYVARLSRTRRAGCEEQRKTRWRRFYHRSPTTVQPTVAQEAISHRVRRKSCT